MKKYSVLAIGVIVIFTTLFVPGCGKSQYEEGSPWVYDTNEPTETNETIPETEPVFSDEPASTTETTDGPAATTELNLKTLTSQTLQPSAKDQTVTYNNQVSVTVPGGLISESQELTISSVNDALPDALNSAKTLATYDISLGDQHEFSKPLTLELAYDPAQLTGGLTPEHSLFTEWWDASQNQWWRCVSQVDTKRNVVVIKTNHLTPWRISMWARGDQQYPSKHFIVVWNPDENPTINRVNQNPRDFARTVSNDLEAAYQVYLSQGFYVAPADTAEAAQQNALYHNVMEIGITWVIINSDIAESQTGTKTGDISLKSEFRNDEEIQHDSAHELFHTIHLRRSGMATYAASQWWAEMCADYAATRIAWPNNPGMALLNYTYLGIYNLTTVNNVHEYQAARFIEYLVRRGVNFKALFDAMSLHAATTANLDDFIRNSLNRNLLDTYRDFLAYVFFDANGPLENNSMTPSLLQGDGHPKQDPDVLGANVNTISNQLGCDGDYGAYIWGFKVEGTGTRSLTINLSPVKGDALPSNTLSYNVYILHNGQRVNGGVNPAVFPDGASSINISVPAGDVVFIMPVAGGTSIVVDVKVTEASKPAALTSNVNLQKKLTGPNGMAAVSGTWQATGKGITTDSSSNKPNMVQINIPQTSPATSTHIVVNLQNIPNMTTEQENFTASEVGYDGYTAYTYKTSWAIESSITTPTIDGSGSGGNVALDFTYTPGYYDWIVFHFYVDCTSATYDSEGNLMSSSGNTRVEISFELDIST